jgi:hypothetical protein
MSSVKLLNRRFLLLKVLPLECCLEDITSINRGRKHEKGCLVKSFLLELYSVRVFPFGEASECFSQDKKCIIFWIYHVIVIIVSLFLLIIVIKILFLLCIFSLETLQAEIYPFSFHFFRKKKNQRRVPMFINNKNISLSG